MALEHAAHTAKRHGISKSAMNKKLRRVGIDPAGGPFDRQTVDKRLADSHVLARKKISDPPKQSLTHAATFAEAQRHREIFKARHEQLKFELASGKLIAVETVKTRAFQVAQQIRDQLLIVPDRLSGVFAAEVGRPQHYVHQVMIKEIHSILTALSKDLTK